MAASESVRTFYDEIADEYHLMFADWRAEVRRQSAVIGALAKAELGADPRTVLDCTCGIGTQAVAMALGGAAVTATDLSEAAVARALKEAASFGVALDGRVADLRTLDRAVSGTFDLVMSFDNSLSHLVDDRDLSAAARQMRARVAPGGLLLASIRDYDAILSPPATTTEATRQQLPGEYGRDQELPKATLPRAFDQDGARRVVFQVWDWATDRKSYAVNQFFLTQDADAWRTSHHVTRFRALRRSELAGVLSGAGFRDVRWLMPEESGFYQPVVAGRA